MGVELPEPVGPDFDIYSPGWDEPVPDEEDVPLDFPEDD